MENEFENKIARAMKRFEGKNVKITLSGIIESRFFIRKLEYSVENGILAIEECDGPYLDIDIDDIEKVYFETASNGYALLVIKIDEDIQIELQIKDENIIPISEKILKWIQENGIADELYDRQAWGA